MTKDQRRIAELEVELWNLKHDIGTLVLITRDDGSTHFARTRDHASVSASGQAVCFFTGIAGYYLLSRAEAIPGAATISEVQ